MTKTKTIVTFCNLKVLIKTNKKHEGFTSIFSSSNIYKFHIKEGSALGCVVGRMSVRVTVLWENACEDDCVVGRMPVRVTMLWGEWL